MEEWDFLFSSITRLSFSKKLLDMVKILLGNASTYIETNGVFLYLFLIKRRMIQGYLVASSLFLIVAKIINIIIAKDITNKNI